MHMTMKGKSALITGSSNGLGLAMAQGLARAGCNIVLHGLERPAAMERTVSELKEQGVVAVYLQADLRSTHAVDTLLNAAREQMGSIDVLVNNAVVRHFASIDTFPEQRWNEALSVNLSAAFRAIQLALPDMRSRRWGRIFNMTSVYGSRAVANRVDYVTTKTALLGLTRAVAIETVNQGITCNAICPGSVLTPNIDGRIGELMDTRGLNRDDAVREFLRGKQPTGELVEAAHVADLLVFLCSASANQITGATMPIEGGWLAS
ncbi:D-beta-hydroxybutyrate dehydrogenase [Caballeronia glathei]|nr:D-beta-hydroxybutyrate dehydrogenase [Caballeronia glathei]